MHFLSRLEWVLTQCFRANDEFKLLLKSGFEYFLNLSGSTKYLKPAELLARHIDKKLRGERGGSGGESQIEADLDASMKLFRYLLQEKDVFEAFYKKLLAKRLLLGIVCFSMYIVACNYAMNNCELAAFKHI